MITRVIKVRNRPGYRVAAMSLGLLTGLPLGLSLSPPAMAQDQPTPVTQDDAPTEQREPRQERDRRRTREFDGGPGRDGQGMGGPGMGGPGGMPGMMGGGMMGGGGFGRLMQPEFVRRDLTVINQVLNLDQAQRDIVENMLLDYESDFELAVDAMRSKFQELRPPEDTSPEGQARNEQRRALMDEMRAMRDQMREARRAAEGREQQATPEPAVREVGVDPVTTVDATGQPVEISGRVMIEFVAPDTPEQAMEKMRARFEEIRAQMTELRPPMPSQEEMAATMDKASTLNKEWLSKRSQMREVFTSNLQSVLIPDQTALYPELERTLRREKSLPRGQISGESANLFFIVRDTIPHVPAETMEAVQPLLAEYSVAMDEALVRRDNHVENSRSEYLAAMRDRDVERALQSARKESELRVAIRTVNDAHAEQIAAALPADVAPAFRDLYKHRAYERVYGPTTVQRAFIAARKFEGLDPTTIEAITSIEQAYVTELDSVNERLFNALREQEAKQSEERIAMMAARMQGQDVERPESGLRPVMEERRALEDRYRPQLESLLSPEQIAELPQRRGRDGGSGRGQAGDVGWRRGGFGQGGEIGDRGRMIERFDTDGDGQLNDAERDAVRQQFNRPQNNQPGTQDGG